jgi:hypothetical protein
MPAMFYIQRRYGNTWKTISQEASPKHARRIAEELAQYEAYAQYRLLFVDAAGNGTVIAEWGK